VVRLKTCCGCGCTQMKAMEEVKARAEVAEAEVRTAKKEAAKHHADGGAIRRALSAHEAALEALSAKRSDVLEAAQMEQVSRTCAGIRSILRFWDA
jgi:hypothetical protein